MAIITVDVDDTIANLLSIGVALGGLTYGKREDIYDYAFAKK